MLNSHLRTAVRGTEGGVDEEVRGAKLYSQCPRLCETIYRYILPISGIVFDSYCE